MPTPPSSAISRVCQRSSRGVATQAEPPRPATRHSGTSTSAATKASRNGAPMFMPILSYRPDSRTRRSGTALDALRRSGTDNNAVFCSASTFGRRIERSSPAGCRSPRPAAPKPRQSPSEYRESSVSDAPIGYALVVRRCRHYRAFRPSNARSRPNEDSPFISAWKIGSKTSILRQHPEVHVQTYRAPATLTAAFFRRCGVLIDTIRSTPELAQSIQKRARVDVRRRHGPECAGPRNSRCTSPPRADASAIHSHPTGGRERTVQRNASSSSRFQSKNPAGNAAPTTDEAKRSSSGSNACACMRAARQPARRRFASGRSVSTISRIVVSAVVLLEAANGVGEELAILRGRPFEAGMAMDARISLAQAVVVAVGEIDRVQLVGEMRSAAANQRIRRVERRRRPRARSESWSRTADRRIGTVAIGTSVIVREPRRWSLPARGA